MSLQEKLNEDLKSFLKAGDQSKTGILRMLTAAVHNEHIKKGKDKELTDEDVQEVLRREAKKRKESIEAFTKGNRPELAEKEQIELALIETYLPKQMSREEVAAAVGKILAGLEDKSNQGMVMKAVMQELKGKADGKLISEIVRAYLDNNS